MYNSKFVFFYFRCTCVTSSQFPGAPVCSCNFECTAKRFMHREFSCHGSEESLMSKVSNSVSSGLWLSTNMQWPLGDYMQIWKAYQVSKLVHVCYRKPYLTLIHSQFPFLLIPVTSTISEQQHSFIVISFPACHCFNAVYMYVVCQNLPWKASLMSGQELFECI